MNETKIEEIAKSVLRKNVFVFPDDSYDYPFMG